MPSIILNTSFLGCYNLSKIYIGKDTFVGKMDLSTTSIKGITTPEKYDPNEKGVISIGDKTAVELSKKEETPNNDLEELNNAIANLNQELNKEKLDKQELQNKVNNLNSQLSFIMNIDKQALNILGQHSKKEGLLLKSKEVIEKINIQNQLINTLKGKHG